MDIHIIPRDISEQSTMTIVEYRYRLAKIYRYCDRNRIIFQTLYFPTGLSMDIRSVVMPHYIPEGAHHRHYQLFTGILEDQLLALSGGRGLENPYENSKKRNFNLDGILHHIEKDPTHVMLKVCLDQAFEHFGKQVRCVDLTSTIIDGQPIILR